MMLTHMPQHIEPAHRLHPNISDDHMRLDGIQLLERLLRKVKWKNLMTFLTAKCDDHLHHRRLVVDDYDLGHSQRGEYFTSEKRKGAKQNLPNFAANHHPRHRAGKRNYLLINISRSADG